MCAIPVNGRRACATAINLVENRMNRVILCSSNAGRGGVDASADWTGKLSGEKLSAMDFDRGKVPTPARCESRQERRKVPSPCR